MAGDDTHGKDDGPSKSLPTEPPSSSSSEPSSSSSSLPNEPFRDRSNAPHPSYPLPAHHDHPPRALPPGQPSASTNPGIDRRPLPPPFVTPPLFVLRGRPTSSDTAPSKNDERCITYCTQTAERRAVGLQPLCKTWCWRRLYPHDFLTVEQYEAQQAERAKAKTRQTTQPGAGKSKDGNTGTGSGEGDEGDEFGAPKPGIFGFDGRYVYYGRSRFRAKDRLDSMTHRGLTQDWTVDEMVKEGDHRREDKLYMDWLRHYHYSIQFPVAPLPEQMFDWVSERFTSLMKPMTEYIDSFQPGGAQEKFAVKVWDKAKEGGGWVMFRDASVKMWEKAREMEAEERAKKNNGNGKGGAGGSSSAPPSAAPPPASS